MLLCKESRDRFIWWLYLALTLNAIVAHDDVCGLLPYWW